MIAEAVNEWNDLQRQKLGNSFVEPNYKNMQSRIEDSFVSHVKVPTREEVEKILLEKRRQVRSGTRARPHPTGDPSSLTVFRFLGIIGKSSKFVGLYYSNRTYAKNKHRGKVFSVRLPFSSKFHQKWSEKRGSTRILIISCAFVRYSTDQKPS